MVFLSDQASFFWDNQQFEQWHKQPPQLMSLNRFSYWVSEAAGLLLKFIGSFMEWSLFWDTQLDPEDSADCPWNWTLKNKRVLANRLTLTSGSRFSRQAVRQTVWPNILLCLRRSSMTIIAERMAFGVVTLQKHTAGPWRLCFSVLLFLHLNTHPLTWRENRKSNSALSTIWVPL